MIRVNRLVGSFFRRVSIKRLLVPPLHLWLVTLLLVAVIGVGGSVAGWQAVLNDQDSALHQRFDSLAKIEPQPFNKRSTAPCRNSTRSEPYSKSKQPSVAPVFGPSSMSCRPPAPCRQ